MFMSYMLIMNLKLVVDGCDSDSHKRDNITFSDGGVYKNTNVSSMKTVENDLKNINYTKFLKWSSSDIDYSVYHAAIVQESQEAHLNIALIVDTSCTKDDIIKLTTMLKTIRKTAFCYQMDVESYDLNIIIQFLLASKVSLAVLFQPWYVSIDLLDKMKYYGLTTIDFITIEVNPSHLRHMQVEDIFLEIINLQASQPTRMPLNHSSCSFTRQDSSEVQDAMILARDENPVKLIRVVTKFDMFVQSLPEHAIINGECEIGLPCRVPTRPGYKDKTIWYWQCCSGAFIDVLDEVIQKMRVSLYLYIVEDGTYNGLIYDVNAGKADIALQQLTPSVERAQLVTPAVISTSDYITIVIRKENILNPVLDWSSVQQMTPISWIGLFVATLVILVVLFILENIGHVHQFNQRYSFRDSFSYVNGLMFQRDLGGTLPRRWPGQIVSILFAFAAMVLVSAFAAQLTARNIVEVEHDFKGLKDERFQDTTYEFGFMTDSYIDHWLNRPNMHVRAKIIDTKNVSVGLDMLINKSIDAYGGFEITTEYEMSKKTRYKNKLYLHNEEGSENIVAFAYSKKSKIGIKLSSVILQLRESGESQHIYNAWSVVVPTKDMIPPPPMTYSKADERSQYARYSVEYAIPLALILGGASLVCALLLLVENFCFYVRNRCKSRKMSVIYRGSEPGPSREVVDKV